MTSTQLPPWAEAYGDAPLNLDYPDATMAETFFSSADKHARLTAWEFMGASATYERLKRDVLRCADAFRALGVKRGQRVTLCLPNCPQVITAFYALNLIGAVAVMIHPLSAEGEIRHYLTQSASRVVVTLDAFYKKFEAVSKDTPIDALILTDISLHMPPAVRLGYALTDGRKAPKPPKGARYIAWRRFLAGAGDAPRQEAAVTRRDDDAVVLFSGGTSGVTKGVLLSNGNFNALAMQLMALGRCVREDRRMLAVLPMFHGFGLGVCMHTTLSFGSSVVLVPRFNADAFAKLIIKLRPAYIVGVPTMYETLLRSKQMKKADLSCLLGAFCGGDSLSIELKRRFDTFLIEHNASITLREGYGLTECVTASCLTPETVQHVGSIGVPMPDTYYKIVDTKTFKTLPDGEMGEICLRGPTVMKGYLNNPEETAAVLRAHDDGHTWLHTGDLGCMDEEGFVYFKQRLKRMIISSGYNIFPSQIENVLDAHPAVSMSCAIGVPDPVKMQRVKAFIVLKDGHAPSQALKDDIMFYMAQNVAKWSIPYDVEFRDSLPLTRVGKVAFTVLEQEEMLRQSGGDRDAATAS